MTTDIVLINWNSRDDTISALESVTPQVRSRPGTKVIVVDNGSHDGTADEVVKRFSDVTTVLRLERNRGFTGGIKAGVEFSAADHVIFLNNDAVAEAGWLDALCTSMEKAPPDVVAIAGKIVDPTGTLVDFIGGVMTFDGHAFQRDFRRPLATSDDHAAGSELLFACGGNMIVRRKEYLLLGGFDDDYFAYLEDVDFGWRSWIAGFRVLYEPKAVARHKSSATSDRLGAFERGVLFERNALQTAIKNFDEELFRQASGAVFAAYLHRLHEYAVERNDSSPLRRPAFGMSAGAATPKKKKSLRDRLLRRSEDAVVIDDPLTVMQFRALHWFFENSERVMQKRATIQRLRKRSDREIFERFPLHYIPTYPGDAELLSSALFELLKPPVRSEAKALEELIRL